MKLVMSKNSKEQHFAGFSDVGSDLNTNVLVLFPKTWFHKSRGFEFFFVQNEFAFSKVISG